MAGPPDIGTTQNCQPRASGAEPIDRRTALRPILLPSGENASAPSTKRTSLKARVFLLAVFGCPQPEGGGAHDVVGLLVAEEGDGAAVGAIAPRPAFSITTCGVPPAALTDQMLSLSRASET
jgi:hypothetical protein